MAKNAWHAAISYDNVQKILQFLKLLMPTVPDILHAPGTVQVLGRADDKDSIFVPQSILTPDKGAFWQI